jgi:uncharacterized membrane protein YeaQ/YmgE (transglycosylase-associated protein family)
MHWLTIVAFAIVLGWICSLVMRRYGMGPVVCLPIAVIGAVLGGGLDRGVFRVAEPPHYSFYGLSLLLCLLALGGGIYAFNLTRSERRI